MTTTPKERYEVLERLARLGIAYDDANALRRIAMTLRRWFELECGDSNNVASWAIERDEATGIPYRYVYYHDRPKALRYKIADRENGARKRLAKIMTKYPNLIPYIQTDPRGCSLYILTLEQANDGGYPLDSIYNRGVAVY